MAPTFGLWPRRQDIDGDRLFYFSRALENVHRESGSRSRALLSCVSLTGRDLIHAQSGITLVQHTSRDAGTTASATLAFTTNNAAGNWIGVAIRAGRTGQTFTVSDSRGNVYRSAVQFNVTVDTPAGDTLAIFYAENVNSGANTITVSQSTSTTLRFAILEYRGIATSNSLDGAIAAQGTGTAPNSGNITTTAAGDLLLGAIVTANGASPTAGSGYTLEERVPAAPGTKLFIEDRIQPAAGTAAANASLGASDNWASARGRVQAGHRPLVALPHRASRV